MSSRSQRAQAQAARPVAAPAAAHTITPQVALPPVIQPVQTNIVIVTIAISPTYCSVYESIEMVHLNYSQMTLIQWKYWLNSTKETSRSFQLISKPLTRAATQCISRQLQAID